MTSQRQQNRANRMLHFIEQFGAIHKFELMDKCGMSVGDYNQIASWFRYVYDETGGVVHYNSNNKIWGWTGKGDKNEIEKSLQITKNGS